MLIDLFEKKILLIYFFHEVSNYNLLFQRVTFLKLIKFRDNFIKYLQSQPSSKTEFPTLMKQKYSAPHDADAMYFFFQ